MTAATWGKPLGRFVRPTKPAIVPTMSPERSITETLARYLMDQCFRVAGDDGPRDFGLAGVDFRWPDAARALDYPRASIIERADPMHDAPFNPYPLTDTLGTFDCLVCTPDPTLPKTVLWKTAECVADLQVDFWCSSDADRQAIRARLGYLFNPGQLGGLVLGGHPSYYSRAVRASLDSSREADEPDAVFANERRLQVNITARVDVVDLRVAVLMTPVATVAALDPGDPP